MAEPDLDIIAINALDRDALTQRLTGSPAEVAAFVRAAAVGGSAEAQAVFGQMLLDGRGVGRDAKAAFGWFATAARQEHLQAINMVGRCYDLGWGTPVDKVKAAEWFRAAAERGLDWGMYNYATSLALGAGVVEDRATALRWFKKAAALGNAKAMNFIGSFHEDGWVVARDIEQAAVHYAKAAEGGDFRGCFNHARMLIVADRVNDAMIWLDRAAKGGNDRFRGQAAAWLNASDDPRLRSAAALFPVSPAL
ncbi:tetratricopeptide repeat protein [soil metagenome]